MNEPLDPRAPAWAVWLHNHPILVSTLASLIIISLVVLVRWLSNSGAWRYHPRGASGFLVDELVRWAVILVPYLAVGITFKYYVYDLHPEMNKPQTWMIFAVCAIAFRFLLRRLPFVVAMGRHIDAAKAQYRAVKMGAST